MLSFRHSTSEGTLPQDDRLYRNFVQQQGLPAPSPASCRPLTAALVFQPRVAAPLILAATLLQSAALFLFIAVLQYWSALLPSLNPFDALYRLMSRWSPRVVPLPSAAAPRRFSMALAGTFAVLTSLAIHQSWWIAAYALEGFLLVAVTAVAVGRLCFGSFLYHIARGKGDFALRTLPWGRGV
jgi:Domain of unknown function (DUF4395)